jgi:hypothetical protein
MDATLTQAHCQWAAAFCGMPALATWTREQAVVNGTPHAAPGGAPAALGAPSGGGAPSAGAAPAGQTGVARPAKEAAPTDGMPNIIEEGLEFVDADRLRKLDEQLPMLRGVIDQTRKADKDLEYVAKLHNIDVANPDKACAVLTTALPAVDPHDSHELEIAYSGFVRSRIAIETLLIDVRADALKLKSDLELLQQKKDNEKTQAKERKELEDAEHKDGDLLAGFFDLSVSALKAVMDIATASPVLLVNKVQAVLEFPDIDIIKDKIKGDQTDDKLNLLQKSMDDLAQTVSLMLSRDIQITGKKLQDLQSEMTKAYDAFVADARLFNKLLNGILDKLPKASSGNPASPEVLGLMLVSSAVARRGEAYELALADISASDVLADLRYWTAKLVPLGQLIFDGRDPSGELKEIMVYQKNGRQTVFNLPSQGLRNSMEYLRGGVVAVSRFRKADVDVASRLADSWTRAMVNVL